MHATLCLHICAHLHLPMFCLHSTSCSLLHTSIYTKSTLVPNKGTGFYVAYSLPSPLIFYERHSDPHRAPTAAPVIKDTDITTKCRISTCHHCTKSVSAMFVSWFVQRMRVCSRVLVACLTVWVLITSHTHTLHTDVRRHCVFCCPNWILSLLQQLKPQQHTPSVTRCLVSAE